MPGSNQVTILPPLAAALSVILTLLVPVIGISVNNSASNNFLLFKVLGKIKGFSTVYGVSTSLSIMVTSAFLFSPIIAPLVASLILQ